MNYEYRSIFQVPSGQGYDAGASDCPDAAPSSFYPEGLIRKDWGELRDVPEVEVVRHYTRLAQMNFGVDSGFYPLGSCTMKYNPKVNEWASSLPGFTALHPFADEEDVQGSLQLLYELERFLCEICGMEAFTLWPSAGAHGEFVGMLLTRAYHVRRGDRRRNVILIPESAHGTNPASAKMCGFEVAVVGATAEGLIDIADLEKKLDDRVAGIMITNPNTLGIFERDILKVADLVHAAGGLLYYDGANLNAVCGRVRPGDMGFDICHVNVHKTFSTPHGGGGPGAGPVGVAKPLVDFLPVPRVARRDGRYIWQEDAPAAIGRVRSFGGNFGVLVRAYAYIRRLGPAGLRRASAAAVLNANYLRARVAKFLPIAGSSPCMHEFTASSAELGHGSATNVDKALIDAGFHPPTTYFPLVVKEALMIEPTETESKATLDAFADALEKITADLRADPHAYDEAPLRAPVRRLDEVAAAKNAIVTYARQREVEGGTR